VQPPHIFLRGPCLLLGLNCRQNPVFRNPLFSGNNAGELQYNQLEVDGHYNVLPSAAAASRPSAYSQLDRKGPAYDSVEGRDDLYAPNPTIATDGQYLSSPLYSVGQEGESYESPKFVGKPQVVTDAGYLDPASVAPAPTDVGYLDSTTLSTRNSAVVSQALLQPAARDEGYLDSSLLQDAAYLPAAEVRAPQP
jgi:hypothetical protein